MAQTLPAMKGRMGTTDYYLIAMKARELVSMVKEPKDMPGWDDEKIEEIYQRRIQYSRVNNQIAPYLAENDSRFFGAVIVAALDFDRQIKFEPMMEMTAVDARKIGDAHIEAARSMGVLTILGGTVMVPLDGQHRLKALDVAMRGMDERGKPLSGFKTNLALATEDISVILVPYEVEKARQIFTRVNRYARRPSASETIITDDDDVCAVLARRVANIIGGRLVRYTGTTLTKKAPEFTTLATLHSTVREIIVARFPSGNTIDPTKRPPRDLEEEYEAAVNEVWDTLLERIDVFALAISDKSEDGDAKRIDIRAESLLGKPVAQECLVRAYMWLTEFPTSMGPDEACSALNGLPWAITAENLEGIWQNVLWSGGTDGRIITKNRLVATKIICHMAGGKLDDEAKEQLLEEYRALFPESQRVDKHLPLS